MVQNEFVMPLVSIGMPVYNGENFIREALDSILNQTFQDFELIISDNASTDETETICREYAAKDQRIRYYRNEKNLGAAPNYNLLVKYSRGKYFKWAAHDDILAPEFLEKCVEVLETNPSVVLAYPRVLVINEQGQQKDSYAPGLHLSSTQPFQRLREYHQYTAVHTVFKDEPMFGVVRANELKKTPLIGSYIASDLITLGELTLLGTIYEVPEYLFIRRKHAKMSVSANLEFDKRILWFNPNKAGRFIFVYWRLFFGYLGAVNRVPMTWTQKLLCFYQMIIFFLKRRYFYLNELIHNLRRGLGMQSAKYW